LTSKKQDGQGNTEMAEGPTQLTIIGGVPATGKTTLLRQFISQSAGVWRAIRFCKLVEGLYIPGQRTFVIGKYKPWYAVEGDFEGTDKLSMAVQPYLLAFLRGQPPGHFVMEGDRLFTRSFLEQAAQWATVRAIILCAAEEKLTARHQLRGDNQGAQFIQSRATKVANIRQWIEGQEKIRWQVENHVTPDDTKTIVKGIMK